MSTPKISVIISSYNHEKYVVQSIESVLQQTFQDFEIIITDDGSGDSTVEQIRSIVDPRIKLHCFDINKGACTATNNCIMHASGEYIAVLNSDDFWTPHKLELQLNIFRQQPDLAAVFTNAQFVDQEGKDFPLHKRPAFFEIFDQKNRSQGQWLKKFFLEGNCLCHPSVLIRRECYNEIGLLDNRYRQLPDFDLWIRLCQKFKLHVMPEKLVRFRLLPEGQNASNQTKTNKTRDLNEFYFIMQRFFDNMPMDIFIDGFHEFLRNPIINNQAEYECAKAFVYLDCKVPWLARCYHLIAFQKLYCQLAEDSCKKILKEKYSFDEKSFMALSPSIDFLDQQPQIIREIQKTELNINKLAQRREKITNRIKVRTAAMLKPIRSLYNSITSSDSHDSSI